MEDNVKRQIEEASNHFISEAKKQKSFIDYSNERQKINAHDEDVKKSKILFNIIEYANYFFADMYKSYIETGSCITNSTYNSYTKLYEEIEKLPSERKNIPSVLALTLKKSLQESLDMIEGINKSVFDLYNIDIDKSVDKDEERKLPSTFPSDNSIVIEEDGEVIDEGDNDALYINPSVNQEETIRYVEDDPVALKESLSNDNSSIKSLNYIEKVIKPLIDSRLYDEYNDILNQINHFIDEFFMSLRKSYEQTGSYISDDSREKYDKLINEIRKLDNVLSRCLFESLDDSLDMVKGLDKYALEKSPVESQTTSEYEVTETLNEGNNSIDYVRNSIILLVKSVSSDIKYSEHHDILNQIVNIIDDLFDYIIYCRKKEKIVDEADVINYYKEMEDLIFNNIPSHLSNKLMSAITNSLRFVDDFEIERIVMGAAGSKKTI